MWRKYQSIKKIKWFTCLTIFSLVFSLSFSCNQVEFYSHSNLNTEHHQSKTECHLSAFSATSNQNIVILFMLLLLALGSLFFRTKRYTLLQRKFLDITSIVYKSPPKIYNFLTYLFSRGILHPKLF